MNTHILVIQLLAITAAVGGMWVLHTAWQAKGRSWGLIAVGWATIIGSISLWTFTSAIDKGVALGVTAWVLVALLFLLVAALKSPLRPNRALSKKTNMQSMAGKEVTQGGVFKSTLTAILIGQLAGLAAIASATFLFLAMAALQVEYTANLAITSILFPVFWGGLAVTLGYQEKNVVRFLTVFGIGASCFLCAWLIS